MRPVLFLPQAGGGDAIVTAAATGIQRLAARHRFGTFKDLKLPREAAAGKLLEAAAGSDSYTADVRYAHRATDPTDPKTKTTTQHGANRLAAVGLAALTVAPWRRDGEVRLQVLGGGRDDGAFTFTWRIWREPISRAAIRCLLGHPGLHDRATRAALGIVELRRTRRIVFGRYMNFTRAAAIREKE